MKLFINHYVSNILIQRLATAAFFLLLVITTGTLGYHFLEDMTLFEGFYMTFITISTIGFSEIGELDTEGRILTIFISLMGIGIIAYVASQTSQILFESTVFKNMAYKKQLRKMTDHYIICGYGRIGHRIAEDLKRSEVPIVIVENRDSTIERIEQNNLLYVKGDAQEEQTLLDAGINDAKGLVCTLSSDQENIFVTLMAREIRENIFILARTNEYKNTKKVLRAGADKVMSPYEIGADRMANVILRPHVDRFMNQILTGSSEEHVFDEIKVFEGSEVAGKTLKEANIRNKYFIVIVSIVSADSKRIRFNPGRDDVIEVGDILIVLGNQEQINNLKVKGCGDNRSQEERVKNYSYLNR